MATFKMTEEHVTEELTGAQGWMLYVWAVENEARMWGGSLRRTSPGYVKQEMQSIMREKRT